MERLNTDGQIDENRRAALGRRSRLGFLPGDQPHRNTKRLLEVDRGPPGIAMETAEVDLDPVGVTFPDDVVLHAVFICWTDACSSTSYSVLRLVSG